MSHWHTYFSDDSLRPFGAILETVQLLKLLKALARDRQNMSLAYASGGTIVSEPLRPLFYISYPGAAEPRFAHQGKLMPPSISSVAPVIYS